MKTNETTKNKTNRRKKEQTGGKTRQQNKGKRQKKLVTENNMYDALLKYISILEYISTNTLENMHGELLQTAKGVFAIYLVQHYVMYLSPASLPLAPAGA